MSAFYPLVFRHSWDQAAIVLQMSRIAVDLAFTPQAPIRDIHEDDAERIINDFIRDHSITSKSALERLRSFRATLSERYPRLEHHWLDKDGREIVLVLCEANLVPFMTPDISITGEICFACGWADFAMPERDIERLAIDEKMESLPLLYGDNAQQ